MRTPIQILVYRRLLRTRIAVLDSLIPKSVATVTIAVCIHGSLFVTRVLVTSPFGKSYLGFGGFREAIRISKT